MHSKQILRAPIHIVFFLFSRRVPAPGTKVIMLLFVAPLLHRYLSAVLAMLDGKVGLQSCDTVDGKAKSNSHHFETMVETIACWYLPGDHHSRVSWVVRIGFRPSTVATYFDRSCRWQ